LLVRFSNRIELYNQMIRSLSLRQVHSLCMERTDLFKPA